MTNTIYCVYITINSNIALPTFYIGSSSVEKVNNGYHGSVTSRRYKETWDKIKNSTDLKTHILSTHETREKAFAEELRLQREFNVMKATNFLNMSMAAKNGYFGSRYGIDNSFYGHKHTNETKESIGLKNKERGFFKELNQNKEFNQRTSNRLKEDAKNGKHPAQGLKGITNEVVDKKVKPEQIDEYLANGWRLGRKKFKHTNKRSKKCL